MQVFMLHSEDYYASFFTLHSEDLKILPNLGCYNTL